MPSKTTDILNVSTAPEKCACKGKKKKKGETMMRGGCDELLWQKSRKTWEDEEEQGGAVFPEDDAWGNKEERASRNRNL